MNESEIINQQIKRSLPIYNLKSKCKRNLDTEKLIFNLDVSLSKTNT